MKRLRNPGMLCLGIWLIATGVLRLVPISFIDLGAALALLAIAAGGLILWDR